MRQKTHRQKSISGLTIPVNTRHELTNAETLAKDSTEYLGNFRYRNNTYDRYEFPGGYATPKPSYAVFDMDFHFYVQDHLGSNVMVLCNTGIEQQTRYYLFGGIVTHNSTNGNINHNKYTGKEFDRMHGLDWYDYVARQYDPVYGRFTSIDPLCEKYPYLSPYAYCGNNPMNAIDPDGRDYWVIKDEREKRITIKANYYAMTSDMKELNKALDFWNGLTYEADGYKVNFELKAIEVADVVGGFDDKEKALRLILNTENAEDIMLQETDKRHNNFFMVGEIEKENENGNTVQQIIKIREGVSEKYNTGAHEVGHTLDMNHSGYGLMTSNAESNNRKDFISEKQVGKIISIAISGKRYKRGSKKSLGRGYDKYLR